jgi:bacterial/archaeal transporter family protein
MNDSRWLIYALLSAAAAALVPVFGKLGMKEADDTLATTVRSGVMTVFLAVVATAVGSWSKVSTLSGKAFQMVLLSGLAGATSWLFYFKAVKIGEVSRVAPIDKLSMPLAILLAVIVLRERPTLVNWLGILFIAGGAYLASMPASR